MTAENDARPDFRPDVPCETQEPPNLEAMGGPGFADSPPPGAGKRPPLSPEELRALLGQFSDRPAADIDKLLGAIGLGDTGGTKRPKPEAPAAADREGADR